MLRVSITHPRCPQCVAFALLIALSGVPAAARAQSVQALVQAPSASVAPTPHDDGRRTVRRLPVNLGRAFVGLFAKETLRPLAIGSAATGLSFLADDQVRDQIGTTDSVFGKSGNIAGHGVSIDAVAAVLFVAGRFVDGQRFRDFSYDVLPAALVTQVTTGAVKLAVGRPRPDGDTNRRNSSFPSGHSSGTFAVATVIERHYGWKAAISAYSVSSLVALSRIRYNRHYLSDVVGGASLGIIVGRATVRMNRQPLTLVPAGATISLAPLGPRGLQVAVTF
jgi:membrane-associated phospholipid phosphatase